MNELSKSFDVDNAKGRVGGGFNPDELNKEKKERKKEKKRKTRKK